MRQTGRATIAQVAARAGVSVSSVSRVMNGRDGVDPDIAERVRAAAHELRYTASPMARSLVLGRTQAVALLVPDLGNPTFQGILRGLTRAAAAQEFHLLVADTQEQVADEPRRARQARERCDALVLCSPRMPDEELAQLVEELAPVVVVNRHLPGLAAPTLSADYRGGIRELAEHLIALGHRHLLYVAGRPDSFSDAERRAGLEAVAHAHGIRLDTQPGGVTFADGEASADGVVASGASAVLAFNDLVAMGLLSALHARGVRVPQDISVTGFDDIPLAAYTTPSLTTAHVPVEAVGEAAWLSLSAVVTGTAAQEPTATFTPELRVRSSSAPPPHHPGEDPR